MHTKTPLHVLLVEDTPKDVQFIKELLKKDDDSTHLVHVAHVASTKEQITETAQFDAVLLDLSLPDSAGLENLYSIRACAPCLPVIVLADQDEEETAIQVVRRGAAQDYMLKSTIDAVLLKRALFYAVERKSIQDELRREKEFTAAVLRNSHDGFAVIAPCGRFKYIDPSMRRIMHLKTGEEVTVTSWVAKKMRKGEDREIFLAKWSRLISSGDDFEMDVEIAVQSEGRCWSKVRLAAMENSDLIMSGQDVTLGTQMQEQLAFANELLVKQNEQLQKMATIDQLTGVLNRSVLYGIAEQQWSRAVRKDECFSVILMDIDTFRYVNDSYGHLVGDMVLERVGQLLNTLTRPYDQVGRWGGEEFLVVLPGTSCGDAVLVAERIRAKIAELDIYVDDETSLSITASFGVAGREKQKEQHLDSLFLQADAALYQSKDNGRNTVVCYEK